ncbi:uncharacterized protein tasor2 [Lampris incognitus]|uniref:uncharacterized protein tasor2 n=1 Tax=Lampris incognitus TaxID=2546036 RepID=UPI0024B4F6D2|nr:uncharacterized protein tasor2 [Lampris incognitus]
METSGGESSEGVLVPVPEDSETSRHILAALQDAYLYEESRRCFRYSSFLAVRNASQRQQYDDFRAKRKGMGYSEEDLKESYGFLFFDDADKVNKFGEAGVFTGNSICTSLGDPSKGVYIAKYSDCLDLNCWYSGKSGYIAIIRLTKGKVKKVSENYTQNFTVPSVGFDCHVSEQLSAVSTNTSAFLAFERTQYYMFELQQDGSNETAQTPSHACPFAVVLFSYTDTQTKPPEPQEKSVKEELAFHYFPWRGQLQISDKVFNVKLKATRGAFIPAKLPAVVKFDRAISISDLRHLLPKAAFEANFSVEVSLDGLHCSLYVLVSSEAEDPSLSLLHRELREKDLALITVLNDGGFFILLHSSHFLVHDSIEFSAKEEALHGMFLFPDSRAIQRGTKAEKKKPTISSKVQLISALNYAESEVEKKSAYQSKEVCGLLEQHIQNYAPLINLRMRSSPSREANIFPDQYDVPEALKHLYTDPKCTDRAWKSFGSYLTNPDSFQLPVSKVKELLAARQEEHSKELVDEAYVCLSSPEEAPVSPTSMGLGEDLGEQDAPTQAETFVDSHTACVEIPVDSTTAPQMEVSCVLQTGGTTNYSGRPSTTPLTKTHITSEAKCLSISPSSGDLPTEIIVSITSAEGTATNMDEKLSMIRDASATKLNGIQPSTLSAATLQIADAISLNDQVDKVNNPLHCPELNNPPKNKRKLPRGHPKSSKNSSKTSDQITSFPTPESLVEAGKCMPEKQGHARKPANNPDPPKVDWRRLPRRSRRHGGKLSLKPKKTTRSTVVKKKELKDTSLAEHEACFLRKKTEQWDLKPVNTKCGSILVPYGCVEFADQIKASECMNEETVCEECPDMVTPQSKEMEQEHSAALLGKRGDTDNKGTMDEGIHLQHIDFSHVSSEPSKLRQSDSGDDLLVWQAGIKEGSSEKTAEVDNADTFIPEPFQGRDTDIPCQIKDAKRSDVLLGKLNTVVLKGKRKIMHGVPEDLTLPGNTHGTAPLLKKSKTELDIKMVESDMSTRCVLDTEDVSKTLSVDPDFALALGLTPKEWPDKMQKMECPSKLREDSLSTQTQVGPQTMPDKLAQPTQVSPSSLLGTSRMQTLEMQQNVSTEYIKKKWWLHFHVSTTSSEKLKRNGCARKKSVSMKSVKNPKEKKGTAGPSRDALTILADLALSTGADQAPQQSSQALERNPDSSSKACGISPETESLPQAMLRQQVTNLSRTSKSPPKGLMGSKDLASIITKEHDYSLPPSPLVLDLPGTSFSVASLGHSAGLQQHYQNTFDNGTQAIHAILCQEDKSEDAPCAPEFPKKDSMSRQRFRQCRNFVEKDGSLTVTREWKKNYDFSLDNKLPNQSMDKTVNRALHGPWDLTIHDTNEEVQLIVHLWIGLFYSRSTARSFHIDTSIPYLEDGDNSEISSGMVQATTQFEPKNCSTAPAPAVHSNPESLDLSKKEKPASTEGPMGLDLKVKKPSLEDVSSEPQVNRIEITLSGKETEVNQTSSQALEPLGGLQDTSTFLLHQAGTLVFQTHGESLDSTDRLNNNFQDNDVRATPENETEATGSIQLADEKEHSDETYFKIDGICEDMSNLVTPQGILLGTSGIACVQGSCTEKTEIRDCSENQGNAEIEVKQKTDIDDSTKMLTDKHEDSNYECAPLVHPGECDENDSRRQKDSFESCPMKINESGSTNQEADTAHKIYFLKSTTQPTEEEPKALFPDRDENIDGDKMDDPVHAHTQLNDAPLPHVRENPAAEVKERVLLTEQPLLLDSENVNCPSPLKGHYPNDNTVIVEDAISAQKSNLAPDSPSHQEHGDNQSADKAASEMSKIYVKGEIFSTDKAFPICFEHLTLAHLSTCPKEMPHIEENPCCEDELHIETHNTAEESSKKPPSHADTMLSVVDGDFDQLRFSNICKSDDKCPTPTMDEEPYDYIPCSYTCGHEVHESFAGEHHSRGSTPTHDEVPLAQRNGHSSRINSGPNPHGELPFGVEDCYPSTELQTLCDLSATNDPFSKSSQFETTDQHLSLDQRPCPKSIAIDLFRSRISTYHSKVEKRRSWAHGVPLGSAKQKQRRKSSHHLFKTPLKGPFLSEEMLPLNQLWPKETGIPEHSSDRTDDFQNSSSVQDSCHFCNKVCHPTECSQATHPSVDQDRHKKTYQCSFGSETNAAQHPFLAVKKSKSDESQAGHICKEEHIDTTIIYNRPGDKRAKIPIITCSTPDSTLAEELTERSKEIFDNSSDNEQELDFSSRAYWESENPGVHSFNLEKATRCRLNSFRQLYREHKMLNSSKTPLSRSMKYLRSGEGSVRTSDKKHEMKSCQHEKKGQTTHDRIETDTEDHSAALFSSWVSDYNGNREKDDTSSFLGPSSVSIQCTVSNTGRKVSQSLVERISQRCLKSDPILSTMEQEYLIFSEQVKQLVKRSRRENFQKKSIRGNHYHQVDSHRKSRFSGPTPLTVCFSSLHEQQDHLEALPSLAGQRFKVYMPEKKNETGSTKRESTMNLHELSCAKGGTVAHVAVSGMTAECARSCKVMMDDVYTGRTLPLKFLGSEVDECSSKSDPNSCVDFSGQLTREMYDSLHSNPNLVRRQSCKPKFRFYILMTSDDPFFDKTKTQLEAEGHTEVQPSQFFLGKDSVLSSLLIILRNQDISEHICKIPHLLELKKLQSAVFAGIDQPEDIINLTYQELFKSGGFIMVEEAVMEMLCLGDMKKLCQILVELSKNGRWKWVLHYKDIRLLKENARLSTEAKAKKQFVDCCQENGIVEVLPYHDCDCRSRDQSSYLKCLIHLQTQNISARFHVFISDTTADSAFGRSGIFTLSVKSFLVLSQSNILMTRRPSYATQP